MMFNCEVNKKLLLMKICFFLYDFGIAPINPFLQTIARQRGTPVLYIGVIFTILPILNVLVRPLTGYITDRYRCRKRVLLCVSLINALFTPIIHFTPSFDQNAIGETDDILKHWQFWLFWGTVGVRMMLWMIGDILQDTICFEILGEDKNNYGRNRVWGAIGWGLSTFLVGGCVDWYSMNKEQKDYLPAYFIAMASLLCHFSLATQLDSNQTTSPKIMVKDIKAILSNVKVCSYLMWAIFAGIFTAYIWFYLFLYIDDLANIYHHERIPWIKTIQGFAVTIECCISEIPIYFLSGYILKYTGHMTAFSISFAMFSLRFFLYSIIEDPLWVLPVEMTNGLSFAMAFIAGVSYAAKVAPAGSEGTLQGLFGMAFHGIGISFGSFTAGYNFDRVGSKDSFRQLSYVAFFTCIVQITVNKLITMRK